MRRAVSIQNHALAKASIAQDAGSEFAVSEFLNRDELAGMGSRTASSRSKELAGLSRWSFWSRCNLVCHRPQDDNPAK